MTYPRINLDSQGFTTNHNNNNNNNNFFIKLRAQLNSQEPLSQREYKTTKKTNTKKNKEQTTNFK
jgi:hypothetical protein